MELAQGFCDHWLHVKSSSTDVLSVTSPLSLMNPKQQIHWSPAALHLGSWSLGPGTYSSTRLTRVPEWQPFANHHHDVSHVCMLHIQFIYLIFFFKLAHSFTQINSFERETPYQCHKWKSNIFLVPIKNSWQLKTECVLCIICDRLQCHSLGNAALIHQSQATSEASIKLSSYVLEVIALGQRATHFNSGLLLPKPVLRQHLYFFPYSSFHP